MARMKFLCAAERCIECNGCVTACKNENEVPWGVNRRRVVTINDGVVGAEKSISVACMHCSDAPCRSEEHTSELQSPCNLVCRLLLEKKKCMTITPSTSRSCCSTAMRSPSTTGA